MTGSFSPGGFSAGSVPACPVWTPWTAAPVSGAAAFSFLQPAAIASTQGRTRAEIRIAMSLLTSNRRATRVLCSYVDARADPCVRDRRASIGVSLRRDEEGDPPLREADRRLSDPVRHRARAFDARLPLQAPRLV